MKDKYKTPAAVKKKIVVREAIKAVAPKCKANFEIPMSAYVYIEKGNSIRKSPVKASYSYIQQVMYEMILAKEI